MPNLNQIFSQYIASTLSTDLPSKLQRNPRAGTIPDPTDAPFPHNDRQFFEMFGNELSCEKHIKMLRWPNGFVCPLCGETKYYWLSTISKYKCANGHKISLTSGTVMHGTKHPLTDWFYSAWLLCSHSPGVSALQMMRKLEAGSQNGMWGTLHKLRSAMHQDDDRMLSGDVEVDEMYVGGKETGPGIRGRGSQTKALCAIAVEFQIKTNRQGADYLAAGNCKIRVVPNAQAVTLLGFIQANVEQGSTIVTDAFTSYRQLESLGYGHAVTVAARSSDPLPAVGRVTANLKRWIAGTLRFAIRKQHVQAYLNEYAFRFNHRHDPWSMFHTALGFMSGNRRAPTYAALSNRTWIHPNPRVATYSECLGIDEE